MYARKVAAITLNRYMLYETEGLTEWWTVQQVRGQFWWFVVKSYLSIPHLSGTVESSNLLNSSRVCGKQRGNTFERSANRIGGGNLALKLH